MSKAPTTPTAQVLIVDDEVDHADVMADALRKPGHVCTVRHSAAEAMVELEGGRFDVIVTDLMMEDKPAGMMILEEARTRQPWAKTIMVTAHGDIPTAKEAIRGGAYDFIEKPLDLDVFRNLVNRAAEAAVLRSQVDSLSDQLNREYSYEGIVGASPSIRQVVRTVQQIAPTDIPVLLIGETGTGKDLVARVIHQNSRRSGQRFKPVNCAAFTESLLESELFGHVKGAFTGAEKNTEGVFEYASGGTLFLDEIGDMSPALQTRLLRVLAEGEFYRVGGQQPIRVDVRVIAATNQDLDVAVREGRFREDLFHRLNVIHIVTPPLRARRDDIPLLVGHYLREAARELGIEPKAVAPEALALLARFEWPGNVRQLVNACRRLTVTAPGPEIQAADIPAEFGGRSETLAGSPDWSAGLARWAEKQLDHGAREPLLASAQPEFEKALIRIALARAHGHRQEAAKLLGWGRNTLTRKIRELQLDL